MPRCSRPSTWRRPLVGVVLAIVALLAPAVPAFAQQDSLVPESVAPPSETKPPPGFALSARQAKAVAGNVAAVRKERAKHPSLKATVAIPATADQPSFEVMFATPGQRSQYGSDIRVDVIVSGLTGDVLEVWTGPQAGTLLARGEEPSVGRSLNRPYVWLPLAAIFLLTFFDPRRPLRLLHLDLLVFSASASASSTSTRGGSTWRCRWSTRCWATSSCGRSRRVPPARVLRAARAAAARALDGRRARAARGVPGRP